MTDKKITSLSQIAYRSDVVLLGVDLTRASGDQNVKVIGGLSGGSGGVTSVAAKTGVVTLTHNDLTDWTSATSSFASSGFSITGLPTVTTITANDKVGISQTSDHNITWANILSSLGLTIGQAVTSGLLAAASTATDKLWINQGGSSDVVQTLSGITDYVLSAPLPTIQITTSIELSTLHHNRRLYVVNSGIILTAPTSSPLLPDGFSCNVVNMSGTTLEIGDGITMVAGSTTLPDRSVMNISATTNIGDGTTTTVLASIIA